MNPEPGSNPFLYLARNAEDNPRGVFSRSLDQTVTNAEAVVLAKQIAFELRRLGVAPGDVVALDLPDQLSVLFTEAIFHEAATSTVLPDGYVADGVFSVEWMFVRPGSTALAQPGAKLVTVDTTFLRKIEENPYGIRPREGMADIIRIVFSSGTTGTPKAIAFGREMEQVMNAAVRSWSTLSPYLTLMDTGTASGIGEFFLSVKAGKPFLCGGGAAPAAIIRLVTDNAVRSLKGSPAQMAALVAELDRLERTLPTIETVFISGTVMPTQLSERMRRVTEGCSIFTSYGSTEAGGAASRRYDSDDPFDAGNVLPSSVVEIVDGEDQPVPDGESGRIRLKSPGMAHGYLGNPDATERAFRDGWFYPGDLGYLRPDGGLTLTGRESELLNAGGVKVDPTRLDHFAVRNAKVIDACSFEYAASSGVLNIGIALVTEDDLDVQQLIAELKAEFGVAAPSLVARVDAIPRTATGKPLRRALAEKYGER